MRQRLRVERDESGRALTLARPRRRDGVTERDERKGPFCGVVEPAAHPHRAGRVRVVAAVDEIAVAARNRAGIAEVEPRKAVAPKELRHEPAVLAPTGGDPRIRFEETQVP